MADTLSLGEDADEADWRALVERGLKGAPWERLTTKTSDGITLAPLYREADIATATDDVAGSPGVAPFVRGARQGPWLVRQSFEHPDPEQTNREILADLQGGVSAIELKIDPDGVGGVAIHGAADLDRTLAGVILEAAPVSLDAGEHGAWAAALLRDKLKGVAAAGTAFNLDPVGAFMLSGKLCNEEQTLAMDFAVRYRAELPSARFLRADARPVHEAGGTEAQEIASALSSGIHYLHALTASGLTVTEAAGTIQFAVSVGPDVLVEASKLRALRLCWARVLEASGVAAEHRAAHVQAFTSKRMMTRYDAETNILRVTAAAFAAAVGGADDITTLPFTDALGLPTPFARRVARNTQLVLMEESHLEQVADPAGGAWFVERLTQQLADKAWEIMQEIERRDGIVQALQSGYVQEVVAVARAARQAAFARRKETIAGVTDFPLLGVSSPVHGGSGRTAADGGGNSPPHRLAAAPLGASPARGGGKLSPIRWATPFEALRERAEGKTKGVFFANLGALAEFSSRALFAQNLFAVGGVGAIGADQVHASNDALVSALKANGACVAVIAGTDAAYATQAETVARALKDVGARWILLAGKPGEREAAWRAAGVDQFVFVGVDVLKELETLHAALGVA